MKIPIKAKFKHLEAVLVGTPKQFLLQGGEYFCVRESCEECPHKDTCDNVEEEVQNSLIPSSRRGVGFENKPFLVLLLKEGMKFESPVEGEDNSCRVPVELWNTPYDPLSLDERNLHFILSDLKHKFRVMKGQIRFYGTKEEFDASEYSKYFKIYSDYTPSQHIVALDFSAIEPRGSAIALKEPAWIKLFEGEPKVVLKQIEPSVFDSTKHTVVEGKTFCLLIGELDKVYFDNQCKSCNTPCKVIREYKKKVSGDFHSVNSEAFFNKKPDWPNVPKGGVYTSDQKDILKKYRNISKVCGLAALYGAGPYTLKSNMNCSEAEAEEALNNFFANLPTAKQGMLFIEQEVIKTGKVRNMFGRVRDVSKWAFSQAETARKQMQDRGYAIRTALNHPIQSSMAEVLKLAMLRADEFISNNKYYPLAGLTAPQNVSGKTYLDFLCCMLLSIHDEIDFLLRTNLFDAVIPPLYRVLQVQDIIKSLGVDFRLEMDVEYDSTRSFTASIKYPASKVFLYNEALSSPSIEPNILLINLSDITPEILAKIKQPTDNAENTFLVGVKQLNSILVFSNRVTEGFLQGLGLSFKKGYLPLKI